MKTAAAAIALAILAACAAPLCAHRLDEYLQATIFSIEKDRVQGSMRLIPGIAVAPAVIAGMDANGDGVISESEQRAYAEHVLRDVSLRLDGNRLTPRLQSVVFPRIDDMKEGVGEIRIEFWADLPAGSGAAEHRLAFEDRHQARISAYLVNCLVSRDPAIHVTAQKRNENQSFYEVAYTQGGSAGGPRVGWGVLGGFPSMFRLGMKHIAEGTDHLLFLLALLLPAPLCVAATRWAGFAGARRSVLQILKVVTAFTVGHSITLALAAWGVARVPSAPVEVLIAVSILISAAHAVRPLFPGREAAIAAFFGLIHGLAFAATLGNLGLGAAARAVSIFGFNVGIEAMQLVVVTAIMPSLILLSRKPAYSLLRIGGALFAGCASIGWILERAFGVHAPVDAMVNGVEHRGVWIAAALFVTGVAGSLLERRGGGLLRATLR